MLHEYYIPNRLIFTKLSLENVTIIKMDFIQICFRDFNSNDFSIETFFTIFALIKVLEMTDTIDSVKVSADHYSNQSNDQYFNNGPQARKQMFV